jgi:hypothetical protein
VATIDPARSPFRTDYDAELEKLTEARPRSIFERGPEVVTRALIHAIESRRPRSRYPVTIPGHVTAWSKRLLPTPVLDWFLRLQR